MNFFNKNHYWMGSSKGGMVLLRRSNLHNKQKKKRQKTITSSVKLGDKWKKVYVHSDPFKIKKFNSKC